MSIQRWWPDIEGRGLLRAVMRPIPDDMQPDDQYVLYADHVAVTQEWSKIAQDNFDAGRRAERRRIRQAIEALPPLSVVVPDSVASVVNDLFTTVLSTIDGDSKEERL